MAIQLIINRELGLAKNENPLQGSFIIEELTDLVEEAVLSEFERLNDRGGEPGPGQTNPWLEVQAAFEDVMKHAVANAYHVGLCNVLTPVAYSKAVRNAGENTPTWQWDFHGIEIVRR